MARQLLFALLVLGLASLACAQYRPHLDADTQTKKYTHPTHKKDSYMYKKDDYDSDEADEPYFKKGEGKDYYKSTPTPTPPPPPPPPSPPKDYDYSYHHKYGGSSDNYKYGSDYYTPSPPPAKEYEYNNYKYKTGYDYKPATPGYDYKPSSGYDYKPGDSMPPPYYPSDDYGGHHPKDVHFTLSESSPSRTNDGDWASTSVRSATLSGTENGMQVTVGMVAWTGTVWQAAPSLRLNWLLTFVIDQEEWEGKIIAAGPAVSQFDTAPKEFPIIGGSGMYEGATGTVTWRVGNTPPAGVYTFEITLWPHKRRHSHPEYASAYTASQERYPDRW